MTWLAKLDHVVRLNQMRLKRRLGMGRLFQLLDVLDNPDRHDPAELEAWARECYLNLFKSVKKGRQ